MEALLDDLKYALRSLRRSPAFAVVAVLSLGLAIGADTAVFSVVDALLVRPLPFAEPSRLVSLRETLSYAEVADLREQGRTLEEIGAYGYLPLDLTGDAEPVQVQAEAVTGGLFATLGVQPAVGRWLTPQDDAPGAAPAVVVSDAFWRAHLGGDRAALGRSLMLSSRSYTVVGVMPLGFGMPTGESQAWVTMQVAYPEDVPVRNAWFLIGVARLRSGATGAAAQAELTGLADRMRASYPEEAGRVLTLVGLQQRVTGEARPALLLLLGAVSLVLLVACANFASLLLARAAGRRGELAVRAALGADRLRLVRHLLTESVLVASAGGALGVLFAQWALPALVASGLSALPRSSSIRLDGRVLAFTCAVSLFTGIVFGLLPAIRGAQVDLHSSLKEGAHAAGGPSRSRLRSALVVAELTMALILLTGTGLLLRSFSNLQSVRLGFDAEEVFTAQIDLPVSRYPEAGEQARLRSRILAALQAQPGVQAAGIVTQLPLRGRGPAHEVIFEGRPPLALADEPTIATRFASRGFFEALRIPLREGRLMDATDTASAPPVVLVNQAFVRKHLEGRSPLGARLRWAREGAVRWLTIVGVVGDVAEEPLDRTARPTIYVPFEQETLAFKRWSTLVVRSSLADPRALAASIKQAVWAADPLLPVTRLRLLDEALAGSLAQRRFTLLVLTLFAGAALLLSGIGVYGIVAYSVAQRTHEIGVRMALGARARLVQWMVVAQGARLALLAVALGVPSSLVLARVLGSLLHGVQPTDTATHAGTCAAILGLALLASWLPARRASRIDPMIALRAG